MAVKAAPKLDPGVAPKLRSGPASKLGSALGASLASAPEAKLISGALQPASRRAQKACRARAERLSAARKGLVWPAQAACAALRTPTQVWSVPPAASYARQPDCGQACAHHVPESSQQRKETHHEDGQTMSAVRACHRH